MSLHTLIQDSCEPLIHVAAHLQGDVGLASLLHCSKGLANAAQKPEVVAAYVMAVLDKPVIADLLRVRGTKAWTDDQLYLAVSTLLKSGADVSEVCKAAGSARHATSGKSTKQEQDIGQQAAELLSKQHEVAQLAQRVATRTLALLLKQRPACAASIKDLSTLLAGVLSNKEYTLLFLTARGADFKPHLAFLTIQAIQHGAAKALPWLLQWQEDATPQQLQQYLQAGLPRPSAEGCTGTTGVLEVLLGHGLSPSCTLRCTPDGSAASPDHTSVEVPLLEWALLHAAATAKLQAAAEGAHSGSPASPGSPTAASAHGGDSPLRSTLLGARSLSGSNLQQLEAASHPYATPPRSRRPSYSEDKGGGSKRSSDGLQLVQLLLQNGAAVNANQGGPLLQAALTLQRELVLELVQAGADVTLPRLPSGQDLVKWAVDTRCCPTSSGVLQALLSGVKSAAREAKEAVGTAATPGPASAASSRHPSPGRGHRSDAANGYGGSAKLQGAAGIAAAAATIAAAKQPPLMPAAANIAAPMIASPMIVLGGQARAKAAEATQQAAAADEEESRKGFSGSLLPASMLTEIRRDEAFLEAVTKNDLQVVTCLLEAGADVHYKQDKALLLALGAINPDSPDSWMPRPRDRAPVLSMSRPLVELLLAHGADINARSGRALCQAARWKDDYSITYLLAKGASADWVEKDVGLKAQGIKVQDALKNRS